METIERAYCPDEPHQWQWCSKDIDQPLCTWVDVDWHRDKVEDCPVGSALHGGSSEGCVKLRSAGVSARKNEDFQVDVDIDEELLDLQCLVPPTQSATMPSGGVQVRLSFDSATFARRGRGLPLIIEDGGEEEAE